MSKEIEDLLTAVKRHERSLLNQAEITCLLNNLININISILHALEKIVGNTDTFTR